MSGAPSSTTIEPKAPAAGSRISAWGAALLGVLIAASYPAVSRVAVQGSLTPQDLLVLRFSVSGLLLLPFLLRQAPRVPRAVWQASPLLGLLQGWGPAACVLFGLQLTTAAHASALFQGLLPAWAALLAFALYRLRPGRVKLLGIAVITAGTLALVALPSGGPSRAHGLWGDALLVLGPLLASGYLIYVQRTRLNPLLGVALVTLSSAVLVLPWALWNGHSTFAQASQAEIVWQGFFQGVLIGCVGMLCIHHAVLGLGGQTVGAVLALVPVLGLVFSHLVAGESISTVEGLAAAVISVGVWLATRASVGQAKR